MWISAAKPRVYLRASGDNQSDNSSMLSPPVSFRIHREDSAQEACLKLSSTPNDTRLFIQVADLKASACKFAVKQSLKSERNIYSSRSGYTGISAVSTRRTRKLVNLIQLAYHL